MSTTSVGYQRNNFNFFVPGRIITQQLSYSRFNFKKQKREMIEFVSTNSTRLWWMLNLNFTNSEALAINLQSNIKSLEYLYFSDINEQIICRNELKIWERSLRWSGGSGLSPCQSHSTWRTFSGLWKNSFSMQFGKPHFYMHLEASKIFDNF